MGRIRWIKISDRVECEVRCRMFRGSDIFSCLIEMSLDSSAGSRRIFTQRGCSKPRKLTRKPRLSTDSKVVNTGENKAAWAKVTKFSGVGARVGEMMDGGMVDWCGC